MGITRVNLGRIQEGMANLDEVMAAATTGEVGWMTVSEVFCLMLSACDLSGDLERTEQWCRAAAEYASQHNFPFLAATCRAVYGSLLTAVGRWGEADRARGAIQAFESGTPRCRPAGHQAGRPAASARDAWRKPTPCSLVTRTMAGRRSCLWRACTWHGEAELARAVLRAALTASPTTTLDHAPLLRLLVDVLLDKGK